MIDLWERSWRTREYDSSTSVLQPPILLLVQIFSLLEICLFVSLEKLNYSNRYREFLFVKFYLIVVLSLIRK